MGWAWKHTIASNGECLLQQVATCTSKYCNSAWIQILFCCRLSVASHVVRLLKWFNCYSKSGTMRCVFTTNTSSQGIRPRLSSQNLLILNPLNLSTPQYLHKWSVDQINATYSKFEYLPMYIEQSIHQFWVLKEVIINCQNWRKCMKYNLGYIKSFFFSKKMNHLMSDPAETGFKSFF